MEKSVKGTIRKLIVGQDPKNAFAFEVGKEFSTPAGSIKIVEIEEDESAFYFFGNIRFNVWVERDKKKVLWKGFEKMPIMVEYEI